MSVLTAPFVSLTWENKDAPGGATNTLRGLTHSSDYGREGLAMKATRNDRRRVSADPHPTLAEAVTVSRFWRLINQRDPAECWPWLGDTDRDGYGTFHYRGRMRGAHELALSFTTGEQRLPDLDTCHSCDNPSCCNPAHLRFDTRLSNVRDMHERGRHRRATKLTAAQVVQLRQRRAAGARQKDLAEQYGITDGQVSMIVRGQRWPDAGGPIQPERTHARG